MLCSLMRLPELPPIELAEVEDLLPEKQSGFLRLRRQRLVIRSLDRDSGTKQLNGSLPFQRIGS